MIKTIEESKTDFLIVGADRAIASIVKWSKSGPEEVRAIVSDLTYWNNKADLMNVSNLVNALLVKNECIEELEVRLDKEESGR